MKKMISLIISASIFLQMVIPASSMVTYAQTNEKPYGFRWEKNSSLDIELQVGERASVSDSQDVLVSWQVDSTANDYILEYVVEDSGAEDSDVIGEKIRFTFNRGLEDKAAATLQILNGDEEVQQKEYRVFDFTDTNPEGRWDTREPSGTLELEIPVGSKHAGSKYPGGRVRVGDMEIRFKLQGEKVYFQTNQIKHGNITPFSLKYGTTGTLATINALTGISGYSVSPVHIEVNGEIITNKETIIVPGDDEKAGSRPGIRIDFNRPKQWEGTELSDIDDEDILATLVLEDLTDAAKIQLNFRLDEDSKIVGLDKKLIYKNGKHTLYLAKEDHGHPNIVKWENLKESMILKKVELSLIKGEKEEAEALGIHSPQPSTKGRYTYLGYTIERSSMEEAFMEIQPYNGAKNTEYTYIIESAPNLLETTGEWGKLVEHRYMSTGDNTEKPFTLPVPFAPDYENQYYRLTIKYGEVTMYSQILNYKPKEDLIVTPPTPIIQSIDNIYAVPPEKLGDQPETIGFDLTWSAPKNTSQNRLLDKLLEQGSIYYELFFHESLESTEGRGTLIKVFKVSAETDEKDDMVIKVEPYGGGAAGKETAQSRYNSSKDTFTMKNVVLKKQGEEKWEQMEFVDDEENYEKGAQYPSLKAINGIANPGVPGIYYLTMRALYEADLDEPNQDGTKMGVSNTSNAKSITISPLEEVIPVPTKIESKHLPDEEELNIIRQSFSWENVDLYRYIKQMLEPVNLRVDNDEKGVYEVYLYQKKNIQESELTALTTASAIILNTNELYQVKDKELDTLRKGGVIRLDYPGSSSQGMNHIVLEGLDANQVYYTTVRVRLDLKDKDDDSKEVEERYSVFSKEHSFTTYTKPSEPGPGERVPPVPEELQVIDQPNNTTVTIGWKSPEYNRQEDEKLYYEMIRVDSRTLAKEEDSRMLSIKKLLGNNAADDMYAWRTKEALVEEYTKDLDTWSQATPDQASNKLQLEDDTLSPNQIYYYYVRTVLMVKGEEVYSSWVGVPVTTDPVQRPIQLKVENKDTYSHDPKREIVISFLAPIPKGSEIPAEYDFDIAVQGELDDNYRLDYSTTRLTSKVEDKDVPTGYAHFVYKINKVKPGKRYDIKVRVIDKVVDMVNGQYPKSLYSERVTTRTHFDQDEQDKEDKFQEYLKYFEDKVEALRRKPYWTLEDGANEFSIKYRSNYIIPEINNMKTYQLAVREGVKDFTYYMPASVIASANLNQTSFEIKQGDVTYVIRPATITTELEELKVALEDISVKRIRDYYVAFYFKQIPQATNLGVDGFLTPKIVVDIDLVRLKEEDLFLEDDMMIALNNEINKEKTGFIYELEKALERGKISNEELDTIINGSVATIEKNHQRDVRNILGRNISKTILIDAWNQSMLIMAITQGSTTAQAYQLGWQDIELPTFNVAGGYGLEATKAGTYAFKGQKITMPVIPGVSGANNLIAKYQLTDFFGTNGVINPNNMANKKDVLGAMARVLGAPRGADYVQYLKQRGIKGVTNLGMNLPMKKGEGIYLLMQVYEVHLKKPISTVYVGNRNIVSNIRAFNSAHQPYILVAADTKIISIGSGIKPNDHMQIKDVLQVLTNIMTKLR